ncbi:uncharacterized protein LOC131066467 [Cryptomeria japonica]|uniref:uncharacterized protein LOC131066467 n=1 Tax=Cryptomeria japonica TaxID=3369 RepID=UPI0027DA8085|nr:uncharacterized protein LOC131066467 [Cryptomeria japonica]
MACSVDVPSNFIVDEKENSETTESHNPTVPVVDSSAPVVESAEPAVAVDLGVSDNAVDSPELVDDRLNTPEKPKVKKVTFFTVKQVDSAVDLEKGLNIKDDGEPTRDGKCGEDDCERVCRVCHLSSDCRSELGDVIQIGCRCKDDLGIAHRHCAEAWFRIRGNRSCEICGETAKNIVVAGDAGFMEEWNERDVGDYSSGETPRCWRGRPLCKFLMACMVVAFILPWFFRVSMF